MNVIIGIALFICLPLAVLAGTGLLVLEGREAEFPELHKLCRRTFYGIGIMALIMVMVLGD